MTLCWNTVIRVIMLSYFMYIFNLHNIFQSLPIILQPQASPSCKLLTAYLQNVAVQWTKSNDACKCRARTTLRVLRPLSWLRLKNNSVQSCTDLLPPMQLWFHCAHSGTFAWVAPNDIPLYKARQLFFLHVKEAIATKNHEAVPPNSWGCPFIKSVIFLL